MPLRTGAELSDRAIAWVLEAAGPQAKVQDVRRLYGGISSAVHGITLKQDATEVEWVLRQFDHEDWLREEPDLARHEAYSLRLAGEAVVPTPEIIAWDETGVRSGMPAVLMTKLAGSVLLQPESMELWIGGLAESLARIHRVEAAGFPWTYFSYQDVERMEFPRWSSRPDVWHAVLKAVRGPKPDFKPCLIHRDFHPTNVLWEGSQVSGIVDWVNACRGPAGVDVGHCRVNLAQLFGVKAADAFLSAYLAYAGEAFLYDPYWDLVSVTDMLFGPPTVYEGWTQLGFPGLTDELIRTRLDAYAMSLLERAGHSTD
ncbi:aminoglycoside phosphotransferase family protein [Paenibacillus filicis]|uniref:Aminoglycoside phosphotransferase family protein n=1 Tax=Paenibacillus filicis TaxID=669464 RepID=A0ABU9DW60_9BACL